MKRTSEGSGRFKTEKRLKLEKANLIELMCNCTLLEIADIFGVSKHMVQVVLSEQLSKKNIGIKEPDNIMEEEVGLGAWQELKQTDLYKKLMKNEKL